MGLLQKAQDYLYDSMFTEQERDEMAAMQAFYQAASLHDNSRCVYEDMIEALEVARDCYCEADLIGRGNSLIDNDSISGVGQKARYLVTRLADISDHIEEVVKTAAQIEASPKTFSRNLSKLKMRTREGAAQNG